jgi:hypothetical protein
MKDPLDTRDDPYERFNEDAKEQGKPLRVSLASKGTQVRVLFGQLRARSKNRRALESAYDRLNKVEARLAEDIYYYRVEEERPSGQPLPEPEWDGDKEAPLPEVAVDSLLAIGGAEPDLAAPLEYRPITISASSRYDQVRVPELEVVFEK